MEKIILEHREIMTEGGSSIWELIADAMKKGNKCLNDQSKKILKIN